MLAPVHKVHQPMKRGIALIMLPLIAAAFIVARGALAPGSVFQGTSSYDRAWRWPWSDEQTVSVQVLGLAGSSDAKDPAPVEQAWLSKEGCEFSHVGMDPMLESHPQLNVLRESVVQTSVMVRRVYTCPKADFWASLKSHLP